MIGPSEDDFPKLAEDDKEQWRLTIYHRGWVFCYNYGTLILVYPG